MTKFILGNPEHVVNYGDAVAFLLDFDERAVDILDSLAGNTMKYEKFSLEGLYLINEELADILVDRDNLVSVDLVDQAVNKLESEGTLFASDILHIANHVLDDTREYEAFIKSVIISDDVLAFAEVVCPPPFEPVEFVSVERTAFTELPQEAKQAVVNMFEHSGKSITKHLDSLRQAELEADRLFDGLVSIQPNMSIN